MLVTLLYAFGLAFGITVFGGVIAYGVYLVFRGRPWRDA